MFDIEKVKYDMKILLNGATSGTNFGDFLFAKMFSERVGKKIGNDNVYWYDGIFSLSSFYKKHLSYDKKYRFKDIDALIYIAGGYFCGNDTLYRHYIIRFFSYFLIGMRCIIAKKPFGIFAVDVGEVKCRWLRWVEKTILKKAKIVIVRNKESLEVLEKYGIKDGILTADAVFGMDDSLFANETVSEEISACKDKKLFLHISSSNDVNNKIIKNVVPGLNEFLANHTEYAVVIGLDQYPENQKEIIESVASKIECKKVIYNYFDNPVQLCKVLDDMDCIVTPKLHVGIVGAKLSKSVISFSNHTQKISRLYNQLGETERSVSIDNCNEQLVKNMIEKYHNIPISVSDEMSNIAYKNFELLDGFIDEFLRGK